MPDVTDAAHRAQGGQVREWLATVRDSEDLVSVGAYVAGANPRVDAALGRRDAMSTLPVSAGRHLVRHIADALDGAARALTAPRPS